MGTTTNYDVRVRYIVDGTAARAGTAALTQETKALARESTGATSALTRLGAAAGALFGIERAKKSFIDFNSSVQDAKIGLSAMLEGNLGGTWEKATDNAEKLYTEFQKFSVLTPVTTQEIMEFGNGVAVSLFQAGGSMKDFTKLTEQGVIAAKVFAGGHGAGYASLELSEMLAGNVNKRMMFAKQILGIAKVSEEEFKKMSGTQRIETINKVLDSDAMKNAAKAFGDSWTGVTSTLSDKLQILGGKIGLPLFKALTKEVQSWSTWIDANTVRIEQFAHSAGEGLVSGFRVVKDALSFLVDHASLLITVGKVWAAIAVGNMIAGKLGGGAGGIAGALGKGIAWGKGASDGYDANGGYQFNAGGAGRQAVTRGNIGGALPMLGQSFGAGVAIGGILNDQFGASHKLTDAMEMISPRVDAASQKFYDLEKSAGLLNDELDKQRARNVEGFGGTNYQAQLSAQINKYKGDVNALDDFTRAYGAKGPLGSEGEFKAFQARGVGADEAQREKGDLLRLQIVQAETMHRSTEGMANGITMLNDTQIKALDVSTAQRDIMDYFVKTAGLDHSGTGLQSIDKFTSYAILAMNAAENGGRAGMAEKPKVNVTIQRIEVQSDDPDRFAMGLVESFRDAVKNPSSALASLREG